jgi:hypothetical protein
MALDPAIRGIRLDTGLSPMSAGDHKHYLQRLDNRLS